MFVVLRATNASVMNIVQLNHVLEENLVDMHMHA